MRLFPGASVSQKTYPHFIHSIEIQEEFLVHKERQRNDLCLLIHICVQMVLFDQHP